MVQMQHCGLLMWNPRHRDTMYISIHTNICQLDQLTVGFVFIRFVDNKKTQTHPLTVLVSVSLRF